MSYRMTVTTLAGFAIILGGSASFHDPNARAEPQKPVKETVQHIDGGMGMPGTLSELWQATPVVIDATITGSRPADLVIPGSSPSDSTRIVRSAYRLKINEVFKDDTLVGVIGQTVEVVQVGGDRDRGPYIESVHDKTFRRFKVGERYILFLKPSREGGGTFVPVTNTADSAFHLSEDGSLQARGHSGLAKQLQQQGRISLIELLRQMKERRR